MAAKARVGSRVVARKRGETKKEQGCREMMRDRLKESYPEIVAAFVDAAKKGSASHMKLATELLEREEQQGGAAAEGSASRLLREIEAWEKGDSVAEAAVRRGG